MALKEFAHLREKNIFYEVSDSNPVSMFISGIHGDEGGICTPLSKILESLPEDFPPRMELLLANPKALKLGVRGVNKKDINRDFSKKKRKKSWISKEIIELVDTYPTMDYVFSFHEETDTEGYKDGENGEIEIFKRPDDAFYMYDAFNVQDKNQKEIEHIYHSLTSTLVGQGFSLYNGYDDYSDDPNETVQLNPVINGYCPQPSNKSKFEDGSFENWVITQGMKRSFAFEIPSGMTSERKEEMIKIIFDKFIIPFLNQVKK